MWKHLRLGIKQKAKVIAHTWTRIQSCANKDRSRFDNQICWPARPILEWGVSKKGTAENYNCKPSIFVGYCVHALPLCLAWHVIVLQASSEVLLRHIGCDGHIVAWCFVKVVGTILVSVCWPSSSTFVLHWLQSQVEQSIWQRATFCVLSWTAKHILQVVHFFQILW